MFCTSLYDFTVIVFHRRSKMEFCVHQKRGLPHAEGTGMRSVVVSGLHSGINPSPGLGTGRSLRRAWPDLPIEGVDYSSGASGLSDPIFARVHVLPPWSDTDLR